MSRSRRTSAPLRGKVRVGAQHADWLTLIEPSGQFLTLPVLRRAFPDGLPHAFDSPADRPISCMRIDRFHCCGL